MFDDPKKELQKLEEELLRAEEKDEEFERFYSEIYAEFGGQSEPEKPAAKSAPRPVRPRNAYADSARQVPAPRKKGVKGLVVLACLETLGIVGIVLWWLLKIL